ncbi:hypothetical protein FFZ77_27625 [Streptomyces katsurahamanus]|uniref:Uncharacterized protein n=1 Tax=Streptomyces katsurahamanus TaxID=2577098 RepID=A0ABW9P111_9ACTN|nr:hypothetical protein [Streptomyces katsurahamanus]
MYYVQVCDETNSRDMGGFELATTQSISSASLARYAVTAWDGFGLAYDFNADDLYSIRVWNGEDVVKLHTYRLIDGTLTAV